MCPLVAYPLLKVFSCSPPDHHPPWFLRLERFGFALVNFLECVGGICGLCVLLGGFVEDAPLSSVLLHYMGDI